MIQYTENRSPGYSVYFEQTQNIDLICHSGEDFKKRVGERIQLGLLNDPEVQRSVTPRQPSPLLPTKVFLCGRQYSEAEGWGICLPGGCPSRPCSALPVERPARGNTNIKTSEAVNQTKNTSAVKEQ